MASGKKAQAARPSCHAQHEGGDATDSRRAVAIIGIGLMGSQIALEYAVAGYEVICVTRNRAVACQRISVASAVAVAAGLCGADDLEQIRARISFRSRPGADSRRVWLVVESVVEEIAVKARVLRDAADAWPDAILATNTSSISVGDLARAAGAREGVIVTHYWNPPLLMPLVEVCPSPGTPATMTAAVTAALLQIGKVPIAVRKDVPGLVWNRLQFALLRECVWLLQNNVVTPEEVDVIVSDGLARRLRLVGPLATVALGGTTTFDAIAERLFPVLSAATQSPGLEQYLDGRYAEEAHLETLREVRDLGLIAELQLGRSGRGEHAKG